MLSGIVTLAVVFLIEGNKLGAAFVWEADVFDEGGNCTVSIPELTRFDYDLVA